MTRNKQAAVVVLVVWVIPFTAKADYGLHMYIGDFNHSGAGKSSLTENGTTAYNNPAGMSHLSKQQLSVEGQYFMPSATYTDTGSTDGIGAPMTGGNGGDPGVNTFVPGVYYSYPVNNQWTVGGVINVPFGLQTKWDANDWVGRYQSIEIGIETLNFNPSLSYRMNNNWSFGAGVSVQRAEANFKNAIDFGAVCFDLLGPATCAGLGIPAPQSADGILELNGDDWGSGFNLGLMYKANNTTVGVTYRSQISYTLEGNADFTIPPQAAAFAPAFTNTTGRVDLTLPEVFSLGIAHEINQDWALLADVTWTRWSRIKEYRIQFENPAQPDIVIPRNWEDTWRIAIGGEYRLDAKWILQGGVAYAQSAIPDDYFDPTLPINDAYWINIGATYHATNTFNFSFGLAHIIFEERTINYTGTYGETVRGTIDPELNVLGVTLNWSI